jgi:hypothetical protein
MPRLLSSLLVPLQGALALRRGVIAGMMSLVVGCGSQAVEEPPPPEPVASSAQQIVNGTDTTIAANPWQVMVLGYRFCGGAILNEYWVLTAAHCVLRKDGTFSKPGFVVAGSTTITAAPGIQSVHVDKAFTYPGFVDTPLGKDVALLRLATPLDLSGPNVKAIPFMTQVDESSRVTWPGVVARATGWGMTAVDGYIPDTLQTTNLILQSPRVAQAAYPEYVLPQDQLAASALDTGTCDGDSGGPLTVLNGDTRVLAGVISWGKGCGDSRYPVMSARVAHFEPWIRSTAFMLANNVAQTNLSVPTDQWSATYSLAVPEGVRDLTIELSEGTGDGDMYVKFGAEPNQDLHDCRPFRAGNSETCTFDNPPEAGTYYVKVFGYNHNPAGMRLKARYTTPLDFGGMWGYVNNGVLVPHPATGADRCPAGYKPTRLLGSQQCPGCDWDVFLCSRTQQKDREPLYDFGGMWGYVRGALVPNPYTFKASCPNGYTDQKVLGTSGVDYEVHVCYKPHVPKTTPDYPFGGMMGQVDSGKVVPNPATGTATCPPGFALQAVSGFDNVDWSIHYCYQPPTKWDFGGMWGFVNGGTLSPNPVTGSTTCPPGYAWTQLLGTRGTDLGVFLCSRPHQPGSETVLDFGGMWGTVNGNVKVNPFTGAAVCPPGYQTQQVLGTTHVDESVFVCQKPHVPGTTPTHAFGGMWGQINGGTYVPNPSTGNITCPAGFTDTQVLGTGGLDYELHFCAAR